MLSPLVITQDVASAAIRWNATIRAAPTEIASTEPAGVHGVTRGEQEDGVEDDLAGYQHAQDLWPGATPTGERGHCAAQKNGDRDQNGRVR